MNWDTSPVTARETSSAEKAMETPPLTAHVLLLKDVVSAMGPVVSYVIEVNEIHADMYQLTF